MVDTTIRVNCRTPETEVDLNYWALYTDVIASKHINGVHRILARADVAGLVELQGHGETLDLSPSEFEYWRRNHRIELPHSTCVEERRGAKNAAIVRSGAPGTLKAYKIGRWPLGGAAT